MDIAPAAEAVGAALHAPACGRAPLQAHDGRLGTLVCGPGLQYKLPVAELQAGTAFAGYRIEGLAGYGGMGVVYRATDLGLDRTVALKLISTELSSNAAFQRRFEAESKIAASLDHPNVIPIFHAGDHEGVLYLVMRYVEGNDLREEVSQRGWMAPERAVGIVTQVASALDAAHSRGLVHRDVKPANVLLASGDHAYLTDFGLTKRLLAGADETITGSLLGTLDYVAPEQIRGTEVGPQTDVYALGCVLFYALTGRAPFALLEREGKLWAHVSEPPPQLDPGLPPKLDDVIGRAMAKEPEERFRSAGELAEAAASALADQPADQASASSGLVAQSLVPDLSASSRRSRYRSALIRHALFAPFSLALLAATLIAGIAVSTPLVAIPVALFIYFSAVAVICLDSNVQRQILERDADDG